MSCHSGVIFDIQRYSVHDGPGIRTIVFLKGCSLRCPWCSNPEGLRQSRDLLYHHTLCRSCGSCVKACPRNALTMNGGQGGGILVERERCDLCGVCARQCPVSALDMIGRKVTVDEVLRDIGRDAAFYRRSGGGLTLSGGDPLLQPDFAAELLAGVKRIGFNTAVETSCSAPAENMRRVFTHADTIFCDIKLADSDRHRAATGLGNERVLDNIRAAAREFSGDGKTLILRMPLVPRYNDDDDNIRETAAFINSLDRRIGLELLVYHEFAKGKYKGLDLPYLPEENGARPPERESLLAAQDRFREYGVHVVKT